MSKKREKFRIRNNPLRIQKLRVSNPKLNQWHKTQRFF